MPAVCLVAQKPRECTQEYVIIEALIKGDDVEIDILARITLRRTLRMTDRNRAKCENRDRDAKDLCHQTHTVLPLRFSRITHHPTGLIMLLLSWEPSQAVPGRRSVAQRQCRPGCRANRAEVGGRVSSARSRPWHLPNSRRPRSGARPAWATPSCSVARRFRTRRASRPCLASKMDQLTPRCRAQFSKR